MTRDRDTEGVPRASIVAIGDELLFGETVDTNGTWLARELSGLGFSVRHRQVVGDDPGEIAGAVRAALASGELAVATGGLGPTADDRTREAVADLLQRPLRLHDDLLEELKARFRARGYRTLPKGAETMAMVPEGAVQLENPQGAAPGLLLDTGKGGLCALLPGIPLEMKGIVEGDLVDRLLEHFRPRLDPVVHRLIHTVGIPESALAAEIRQALPQLPEGVALAYLPDQLGVRLRLSCRAGGARRAAEEALQEVEDFLEPVLAPYRFDAASGDLAEAVGSALLERGLTLAVAESCTGGLVAKRLTDIPGSSRYLLGGVVAYANEAKSALLGIDRSLLQAEGVVSESVAEAMAAGVARRFGADVGIGVTGIAGPGGGTPGKPVGTVCLSVVVDSHSIRRREYFHGDREAVRRRAAHFALGLVLKMVDGRIS